MLHIANIMCIVAFSYLLAKNTISDLHGINDLTLNQNVAGNIWYMLIDTRFRVVTEYHWNKKIEALVRGGFKDLSPANAFFPEKCYNFYESVNISLVVLITKQNQ